jgi:hypothetical protein
MPLDVGGLKSHSEALYRLVYLLLAINSSKTNMNSVWNSVKLAWHTGLATCEST